MTRSLYILTQVHTARKDKSVNDSIHKLFVSLSISCAALLAVARITSAMPDAKTTAHDTRINRLVLCRVGTLPMDRML